MRIAMQYKAGDRVRVKSRQWFRDNAIDGSVCYGSMITDFSKKMKRCCGKKATVTDVGEGGILWLDKFPHMFCAEMLDPING